MTIRPMTDDEQFQRDRDVAIRLMTGALLIRGPAGDGSGVKVSEDRILTAAHVVLPSEDDEWTVEDAVFDVGVGQTRSTARVIGYHQGYDIAVLDVVDHDKLRDIPLFRVSSDAQVGDPVWVGGYPYGAEVPVVRRGAIASIVMPKVAMIVDRGVFVSDLAEFPAYWLDVPIFPGNSGGPVLNRDGNLIGLANQALYGSEPVDFVDSSERVSAAEQTNETALVPIYMDVGIALRLDIAIPWVELEGVLPDDYKVTGEG